VRASFSRSLSYLSCSTVEAIDAPDSCKQPNIHYSQPHDNVYTFIQIQHDCCNTWACTTVTSI